MTRARSEQANLRRLASAYGVQTRFVDAQKRHVQAKPESLVAVLRGLGAPIENVADAAAALREREDETWCWHIEPVQVAWDGLLEAVELRLPANEATSRVDIEVLLEDGASQTGRIDASSASVSRRANLGGREYVTLRFSPRMRLPDGYHELILRSQGRELRTLVIAAPTKTYAAPAGKHWGFFLPLYALHSQRSWGIGDLTDLGSLVDWAAEQGADFVGTLPLLASFLGREPYTPSPYEPASRLFWNEIYIDLDAAVTAQARYLGEDVEVPAATAKAARDLNAREAVPYREVMALKRRALTKIFARRKDQGPAANEDARKSLAERPAQQDYAAFRGALETLGPRWREWPSPQREGSLTPADYDAETAAFFASAQQVAESQVSLLHDKARARDVRLYLDLPVGVHPDGYDPWRYQHLFVEGMRVGAPPDLLATEGQNWGFQPLNPNAQRKDGYKYTRAYLQHHMRAAGLLRIDHAIGLHRLFWIPEGGTGHDGVFVRQHAEELYAMLSLESHRAEAVLVGENLGLVPREVNRGMARHGIGDMYVQTFAMTGEASKPLCPPRRDSIASFGTHDLAQFAAFWTDEDLDQRVEIGVMSPETARVTARGRMKGRRALVSNLKRRRLIKDGSLPREAYRGAMQLLAESRARWAMVSLEDAWGETQPQNIPGTIQEQYANWTHRGKYALEHFDKLDDITTVADVMRNVRGRKETQNGNAS